MKVDIVGGQGLLTTIPLILDLDEQVALEHSATILREAITSLDGSLPSSANLPARS